MRFIRGFIILASVAALLVESHETHDGNEEAKDSDAPKDKKELNEFDRQHEEAGILVLTDENYEEILKSHPAVLVKFYAPWCLHSREFAPEYIKAGLFLKETNSTIKLARVDASIEKKFAEKYDVKGYPTLKFFKGDVVIDYSGGKTGKSVVTWLEAKMKPPTTTITSVKEAEEFTSADVVTILGLFSKENFTQMSELMAETTYARLDEIPCGVTDSEEVKAHYGIKQDTLLIFKNIDKERLIYEGPFDSDSIATYVKANKLPLIFEFNHHNAQDIFGGNITKHLLLFARKSKEEEFKSSFSQMLEPAKAYKGKVVFIYVNMDLSDNEMILQFFGVKATDPPSVRMIALDMNMAKFKPTFETVTAEVIAEFVKNVLDGKIDPHLPSQDLPEDWDKKPVKVLVAKNFDEVTMDKAKTVFVMFYAPWCEHSKALAPVWEQLAEDYASNDTIVIAKMDSSQNELPDMKVMSFPTLKLFPANSNDVIDYYGMDRELESLKTFLNSGGKRQSGLEDKKEEPQPTPKPDEDSTGQVGEEGEVKSEDPEPDGTGETPKQEL